MKFARKELHKIVEVLKMAHQSRREGLEMELINELLHQTKEAEK